ncbi:hypothetical protein JT318_gp14 [Pseudomonas phage PspYZU01]|uniref:BRCT domain-containing protein n=1 Tax=Pseudomonas phage PspYZU01 TaxID=1983555 RepID=A0A2U7NBJ3_9CAUD|nr:hypothetical protein JT318_gp14 [Pseudomonas phage PspYZU01]ASD51899.1 hypothetical protein PspYZU01_14 [Pseudomonas phage PspYZU01]
MITKLVNRIAAALHTHLSKNPVRMHPKDLEQIVLRLGNIIENPAVRVDTSINPVGMDAQAVKDFIAASKNRPAMTFPGTKMQLSASDMPAWDACRGHNLEQPQPVSLLAENTPPYLPAIPAAQPGFCVQEQQQSDIGWMQEPTGFEEALERACALCLAGRLVCTSVAMYLRTEFHRVPGAQGRIARWCSPAGLSELARIQMRAKSNQQPTGLPAGDFPTDVDLDALARKTKKGLAEPEHMDVLLEHKPYAHLADRLPAITNRMMPLEGATFVLTGSLTSMSRDDAEARVEALGGVLSGSVSRHPIILVRGMKAPVAGAKLQKAWFFNHPVIDETRFLAILAEREAIQGDTSRIETVCTASTCEDALARR